MKTLRPMLWIWLCAWAAQAQTSTQTVNYSYDANGRLTAAYYARGSTNMAVLFAHDPNDNRSRRIDYGLTEAHGDMDGDDLDDIKELGYFGDLDQSGAGDPDGDGLVNSNEFAAAGHPLRTDTDDDGQDDLAEFIAGTALDDGAAFFQIAGAARVTGGLMRLSWGAVAGRTYRLEERDSLWGGAWTNAGAEFVAFSNALYQVDRGLNTNAFYRVKVRLTE